MRTFRLRRHAAGASLATLITVGLAAGCGGGHDTTGGHDTAGGGNPASPSSAPTPARPGAEHNNTDVTFAQEMIPHHRQALDMAALAETRATDPATKALAAKIRQAQAPEIEQMANWLTDWGVPVPSPSAHGGHGGHGGVPGMMSEQEMAAMEGATGASFDRMFLEMMIKHHQGAVEMARTEQQQGASPAAKALAKAIETSQTAEIQQMRALLNKR